MLLAHISFGPAPADPLASPAPGRVGKQAGQGVPTSRKSKCFLAVLRVEALELQMQHSVKALGIKFDLIKTLLGQSVPIAII